MLNYVSHYQSHICTVVLIILSGDKMLQLLLRPRVTLPHSQWEQNKDLMLEGTVQCVLNAVIGNKFHCKWEYLQKSFL